MAVTPSATPAAQAGFAKFLREKSIWYAFLAPALVLLAVFFVFPLYRSLELAFYKWNGLAPRKWVGFDNFLTLVHEKQF